MEDKTEGKCPVMHGAMTRNSTSGTANPGLVARSIKFKYTSSTR